MTPNDQRLVDAILGHLDGTLSDEESRWLDAQLASSEQAALLLVEISQLETRIENAYSTERVESKAQQVSDALEVLASSSAAFNALSERDETLSRAPWGRMVPWSLAIAGSLMVAWSFGFLGGGSATPAVPRYARVARVVSSVDSLWQDQQGPNDEGWLPVGGAVLKRGQVELRFGSGAKVVLEAPAEFHALTPTEGRLLYGKMTARVDGAATDFRIHTPAAEVIDLGTEFGVSVSADGETAVAVFDGMVDVSPGAEDAKAKESQERRLNAGEALRIDSRGKIRRVTTVNDDSFPTLIPSRRPKPTSQPPLIVGVKDNLRDDDSPKFYRVVTGGFREDAPAYVDRVHQWNGLDKEGIPKVLRGADYIMPFNDDKFAERLKVVVSLGRAATVFILCDDRRPPPRWLTRGFKKTELQVGADEGPTPSYSYELAIGPGNSIDRVFSVWRKDVLVPGDLQLGSREARGPRSMYGIAVVPLQAGGDQ